MLRRVPTAPPVYASHCASPNETLAQNDRFVQLVYPRAVPRSRTHGGMRPSARTEALVSRGLPDERALPRRVVLRRRVRVGALAALRLQDQVERRTQLQAAAHAEAVRPRVGERGSRERRPPRAGSRRGGTRTTGRGPGIRRRHRIRGPRHLIAERESDLGDHATGLAGNGRRPGSPVPG